MTLFQVVAGEMPAPQDWKIDSWKIPRVLVLVLVLAVGWNPQLWLPA